MNKYNETQKINLSNIKCSTCNIKNKGITYYNEFYKCLNCNINICPLCKSSYNNKHNIINYNKKNIICNQHGELFFGYCKNCKKTICLFCEDDHSNHDVITYGKIIKDKNKILENNAILKNDINSLNNIIKEIIDKLNIVIKNIELYYEINKNITDNINNKNRNYELLFNIININDNNIHDDIKNIINEKDINIQFNNIMKIYDIMNSKNQNNDINNTTNKENKLEDDKKPKDEILIKYLIKKDDDKINIFGENFVKNNKDKCKYMFENKEYELTKEFDLTNYNKSNKILEIKLNGIYKVIDMSYLFHDCGSLMEVPDISDWILLK